jgi:hypothetical protein
MRIAKRLAAGGALLLVALSTSVVGLAPAGALDRDTCDILGTNGDDDLGGTERGEKICGLAGDDYIDGDGGPDMLLGGRGSD